MNTSFFEILAVIIISLYFLGMLIYHVWSTTLGKCSYRDSDCLEDCQCLQGVCGTTEMGDTKCCVDYVTADNGKKYCL